jgi:hypothetical protein
MQKNDSDRCRCGYSCTETIEQTYVGDLTDRVMYQCQQSDDLRVVPCNLQMIMDWDSHINIEYSGSVYCAPYIYTNIATKGQNKENVSKWIQRKSMILTTRYNYLYMDR